MKHTSPLFHNQKDKSDTSGNYLNIVKLYLKFDIGPTAIIQIQVFLTYWNGATDHHAGQRNPLDSFGYYLSYFFVI